MSRRDAVADGTCEKEPRSVTGESAWKAAGVLGAWVARKWKSLVGIAAAAGLMGGGGTLGVGMAQEASDERSKAFVEEAMTKHDELHAKQDKSNADTLGAINATLARIDDRLTKAAEDASRKERKLAVLLCDKLRGGRIKAGMCIVRRARGVHESIDLMDTDALLGELLAQ